ncbi:hypothetical protein [Qipengyuania sp. JC766]|uniref:hypothetical protein n=1 Tax=Qipengyuania sp. JC766 TaxID=3232139 RepID=UPI00345B0F52
MNILRLRKFSRIGVAIGSLSFVVGGALIVFHKDRLGDGLMIFGGITLLLSALLLSRTPTGDQDAG